jgi:predicted RNase H-like HicB family nuclease
MELPLKLTALFLPCEEGGYTALIRELRGVISEGDTLQEARENLLDALELMLESERERSQAFTASEGSILTEEFSIMVR